MPGLVNWPWIRGAPQVRSSSDSSGRSGENSSTMCRSRTPATGRETCRVPGLLQRGTRATQPWKAIRRCLPIDPWSRLPTSAGCGWSRTAKASSSFQSPHNDEFESHRPADDDIDLPAPSISDHLVDYGAAVLGSADPVVDVSHAGPASGLHIAAQFQELVISDLVNRADASVDGGRRASRSQLTMGSTSANKPSREVYSVRRTEPEAVRELLWC